jgi:hypothetical protein
MKTLLFGLLFAVSLGLKAQDKYEYGVVTYQELGPKKYRIIQSFNEEPKVETGILKSSELVGIDFEPINRVLNELSNQGWDTYNTIVTSSGVYYHFYLKRKK